MYTIFFNISKTWDQGFEIHGSMGAPLPEKDYGWQKKLQEYFLKKSSEKKKRGLKMLIQFLNMT